MSRAGPRVIEPVRTLFGVKGMGITSTSETLALMKPQLFVTTDQKIRRELGFANKGAGCFHYLLLMKDVARKIRQLAIEAGISDLEEFLRPSGREWKAPLANYLDEWLRMNIAYRGR